MDTTVKKLLTGGHKSAPSLRMDLDGDLIVQSTPDKLNLHGTEKKVQLIGRFNLSEVRENGPNMPRFGVYVHVKYLCVFGECEE